MLIFGTAENYLCLGIRDEWDQDELDTIATTLGNMRAWKQEEAEKKKEASANEGKQAGSVEAE